MAMNGWLIGDPELAELFSDEANIRAMLDVEAALARAEAQCGIIPDAAAAAITEAARALTIEPADLAEATARDGVPIPELVRRLREATDADAAPFVHWGATSQDIIDTSLMLRLIRALDRIATLTLLLAERLAVQADDHRGLVMVGRTRGMQAAPTTFGAKIAVWLAMLTRHLERERQLRTRLDAQSVSLGGAVGNRSAFRDHGDDVLQAMARELGIAAEQNGDVWHTARDGLIEAAAWAAGLTTSLAKIGSDVGYLASTDVAEITVPGGGSSTMPNKINPIAAEALVALGHANAAAIGAMLTAGIQEHERGGSGWTLEWMTLPDIMIRTAASARTALQLVEGMKPRPDRMQANLDAGNGLPFAEAVSFALAETMPRPEAQAIVKAACGKAAARGRHLRDVIAEEIEDEGAVNQVFAGAWIATSAASPIDAALEAWQSERTARSSRP